MITFSCDIDYFHSNTQSSPRDTAPAVIMKRCIFLSCRLEHKIEQAVSRQLSKEKDTNAGERQTTRLDDKEREPTQNIFMLSSTKRKERLSREPILVKSSMDVTNLKVDNIPSSRVSLMLSKHLSYWYLAVNWRNWDAFISSQKPLILMVPQSERSGPVSDILKRLCPQLSTSRQPRMGSQGTRSELSQSMMNLSVHNTDTDQDDRGVPVPRLKAAVSV